MIERQHRHPGAASEAVHAAPLAVWFRLALADFDSPDEKLRACQDIIFRQDQPVLESQTPRRLPPDLRAELHTAAGRASSACRRHLQGLGITFGVCR